MRCPLGVLLLLGAAGSKDAGQIVNLDGLLIDFLFYP